MSLLEVICLAGLAYSPSATRPSLRPAVSAHTTLTAIASPPEPPRPEVDLPTPTEEGGQLASLLPLSLLLESQEADRSKDALVGEDAGRFALKNERWGDVAILPAQATGGAPARARARPRARAGAAKATLVAAAGCSSARRWGRS